MSKQIWKPGILLNPTPVVLVTCGEYKKRHNIITIAWTGTINTRPPMLSISLRPERYSYELIKETSEFAVNLVSQSMVKMCDWCGVKSGRDFDKFRETGFTPIRAEKISAPLIEESPVSIECFVKEEIPLGTHSMFLSEVVSISADDKYINKQTGGFDMALANLICYSNGRYFKLGKTLGSFGFSVRKKKDNKK